MIGDVFGVKDPEATSLTAEMEIVSLEDRSQETTSSLQESTTAKIMIDPKKVYLNHPKHSKNSMLVISKA